MKKIDKFTKWAIDLQSIAQDGLEYGHDRFDKERYNQIRTIATEMMAEKVGQPFNVVKGLFSNEDGYQTPKLSTRAAIFKEDQILLVRETTDNLWSMPGGWCEPNISVKENCIKEAKEESGHDIAVDKVISINNHNTNIHNSNQVERAINICNIMFLCRDLGGKFSKNSETDKAAFFSIENLPQLSLHRNTTKEIEMCFSAKSKSDWQTKFE